MLLSEAAPSVLELSQEAKAAAAALWVLVESRASEEQPFSAEAPAPAVHCGTGAAAHSPLVAAMVVSSDPGAQAPAIHIAYLPLPMLFHQSVVQPGVGSTSFLDSSEV